MESIVLKTDGTRYNVVPKNKKDFKLEELQEIVEGYIEIVPLNGKRCMVVNEEGLILGKEYNYQASKMAADAGLKTIIVGDVLICDTNKIK